MPGKSFSQTLSDARLLAAGIQANVTKLAKRGITEEQAQEMESLAREIETLDNEQETLKARLKNTTETLNRKAKELKSIMSTNTKVIKAEIPQSLWKEFGIQAKK